MATCTRSTFSGTQCGAGSELLAAGEQASGAISAVIQEEFGITQPAVSMHLRVLRDNGFATVRAEGTRRATPWTPAPPGGGRLAGALPRVLDPAPGRTGHRARPRRRERDRKERDT